ncbi:hypothetical protein [Limnoglobus roseus]|uniref:Chromosome partition protein Smc n=1 Tax=Limnoglobus roseus TaxID=2598579 RepID=A0A5C1AGU5_9BACT|nr:hypothetical protein [Limnoglobus roseus]QEL16178.1 Chromosome partition protein Smc [Limnoglobus roseus]
MSLRRTNHTDDTDIFGSSDSTPTMATALRPHDTASTEPVKTKSADENGGISMFWRVFGGTILSIVALIGVTLYNTLNNSIAELRSTVSKLTEERAELLKKDEFGTRMNSNWERVQAIQGQNNEQNASLRTFRAEVDGIKEKLTRNGTDLDAAKKDLTALDVMKEKLTNLATEAKNYRDDYAKLRQDVDKNLASDQERKATRDSQHKEIEKSMKDLQTALLDLQIKLARLEGRENPMPMPEKATRGPMGNK